jgi:starch synthase
VGTGDQEYEQVLVQKALRHTKKLRVVLKFDEGLARKIYAASDIFLMPSLYEPCGLGQLIALRYGALPIVRETGGLKDTIISYNESNGEGNGFSFTNYNAHDFLYTIRRALKVYKNKNIWTKIMENAFNSNYSWDGSAKEYLKLYRELT